MSAALLFAALAPAVAACHPINADRIYARDLAAALPVFRALSPEIEVGYAPAPGLERVFHPPELRRIAQANHVAADISEDICFSWSLAVPARASILAAMQETLKSRDAQIEILEQSLSPAPSGRLVFPLSGLCGFSTEPVIWRGYVVYAGAHRFSIWARARLSVKESRLVATDELAADEPVRANQIRVDSYEGPLSRQEPVIDLKDAIGMMARFDIPVGTVLTKNMLDQPKEVQRGDTVSVIVELGSTHIEAEGIAEQSGRIGAVITVHNTKSGRKFRARVEEKDRVLVVPGGPFGLVTEGSKS